MPKIDIAKVPLDDAIGYPEPFRQAVMGRTRQRLGKAAGLKQFGVNLARLKPGAASSQRHWHAAEDEFVYILEGELVLIENGGETVLRPGDAAGWKAGVPDGHCLVNRGAREAVFLEIGTRLPRDCVEYSDIDMRLQREGRDYRYLHKSGEPYRGSES